MENILRKKDAMKDPVIDQKAYQQRKRRDALENYERLLVVAQQLFATQGVAETSMNEIAHVAHVGPGTLYRCFANKGELCEALLLKDIAAFWVRIDAPLKSEGEVESPLSELGRLLDELVHMTETHIPLLTAVQEVRGHPEYRNHHPFIRQLHERVTHLLSTSMAQGEIVELNETFTADVILDAINPMLYMSHRQYRGFSCEQVIVEMRRLFIDGLRVRSVDSCRKPDSIA